MNTQDVSKQLSAANTGIDSKSSAGMREPNEDDEPKSNATTPMGHIEKNGDGQSEGYPTTQTEGEVTGSGEESKMDV